MQDRYDYIYVTTLYQKWFYKYKSNNITEQPTHILVFNLMYRAKQLLTYNKNNEILLIF